MIHSFSFKNFYSFKDQTTINFCVNGNAPDKKSYVGEDKKFRVSKIEMLIGANASGKTNALKALAFLAWLISTPPDATSINQRLPIKPFVFEEGDVEDKPVELSIVFEINSVIYTYVIQLNQDRIIKEQLSRGNDGVLFERNTVFNEEQGNLTSTLNDTKFGLVNLKSDFETLLRKNVTTITTAARLLNHEESTQIVHFFQSITANVAEKGNIGGAFSKESREMEIYGTSQQYNQNIHLKERAEEVMRRYDLGLDGFDVKIEEFSQGNERKVTLGIAGRHTIRDKIYHLVFDYESSGTKQLFVLLPVILNALEKGSIAIIDELESYLHPRIVREILSLFIQPETNPNNAQLIFSTNNESPLEELDKYQVAIVEKNKDGVSRAYRLDEEFGENIRKEDDLAKKYKTGAYGGVPEIQ